MTASEIVLYGAAGYTGRLIAQRALSRGLRLTLAGRGSPRLSQLGEQTGFAVREAALDDARALSALLSGARVLLNAAGPFSSTAAPLWAACMKARVSYLDLTGEVDVLEQAALQHAAARAAGIMLMPAVGFDVVPSDCLASLLARRLPRARALHLAFSGLEHFSRGSALTMLQCAGRPVRARRRGRLVAASGGQLQSVDFGSGPRAVCAVDWGDLVSAYFTTGVSDVTTYFEATPALRASLWGRLPVWAPLQGWARELSQTLPEGPSAPQRARSRCVLAAIAELPDGSRASLRCETPDVYDFSADAACEIAGRVARGDYEAGFQTPARVYGPELLAALSGTRLGEVVYA
ncbi:MAG TPA: saccharopine dehydrogenase NADP-binding domain-containing protein [Polyangiales bacterium]|nr:saccharopine dehydrogenase NADP-binding domain-containing protein [Polyangiales bacterium]